MRVIFMVSTDYTPSTTNSTDYSIARGETKTTTHSAGNAIGMLGITYGATVIDSITQYTTNYAPVSVNSTNWAPS